MRYLDAVGLAKLRGLSLQLRRLAAEGYASGRHRSVLKGFSKDFAQHRAYVPGDELKALDWKVFARQDRYYVREYSAESLLSTQLLVDASGSMLYGDEGRGPKWEHSCRLAMGLAYLVLAQGDAVGLLTFDTEPRRLLPPRASLSHLELIDELLAQTRPGGETDLGRSLELAAARLKRRSLIVLVSDLLGDPARVAEVVKALKARRHEVAVLQVLDPQEREFAFDGSVQFEGLERDERLICDAGALRVAYREAFDRAQALYRTTFHRSAIAYAEVYTDAPWDAALGRLLSRWR